MSAHRTQGWQPERAMARVMATRREQVARWGHTPETDLRLPLLALPEHARAYVKDAIEDLQFDRGPKGRERAVAKLERAGALVLASIDRLLAEDAADLAKMLTPPTTID